MVALSILIIASIIRKVGLYRSNFSLLLALEALFYFRGANINKYFIMLVDNTLRFFCHNILSFKQLLDCQKVKLFVTNVSTISKD